MPTKINLPELDKPRVVVVGGGFAGLALTQALDPNKFQVVLLDKNNYHQFQPLFYQVAMAGLEPSSILFPFRKLFQGTGKYFRMTECLSVDVATRRLVTRDGLVNYDYLVLALGAKTHFFGDEGIRANVIPMKSVSEALYLRNRIFEDWERALTCTDPLDRGALLDTVIVGGGPTGVELAGALAEMKRFILPKDYPELSNSPPTVWLIESNPRLLKSMSVKSSSSAQAYLEARGVKVVTGSRVISYDGRCLELSDQRRLHCRKVIWAAGVKASLLEGLPQESIAPNGRVVVDGQCRLKGEKNIFVIGDMALLRDPDDYPEGHPQVAPVALAQARFLADLLNNPDHGQPSPSFHYKDRGSLATVGRHAAVADIANYHLSGPVAWVLWMFIHLLALLGIRNKVNVLLGWAWSYATYDQPLRVIIRPTSQPRSAPRF